MLSDCFLDSRAELDVLMVNVREHLIAGIVYLVAPARPVLIQVQALDVRGPRQGELAVAEAVQHKAGVDGQQPDLAEAKQHVLAREREEHFSGPVAPVALAHQEQAVGSRVLPDPPKVPFIANRPRPSSSNA